MIMQMSNAEGINLFLVTSVVNAKKKSVYTPDERLEQLIELTLRTIKAKVPSCYIVVMEGSKLTSEQSARIRQAGADELYHLDVNGRKKSLGELALISGYFKSAFFNRLRQSRDIKTISKLSGRYYLADEFDFGALYENLCVIKKTDTGTWSGHGICDTRYYKFPYSYVDTYIEKIERLRSSDVFIDIEHAFYKDQVLPFDRIQPLAKINVKGSLAPNGKDVSD